MLVKNAKRREYRLKDGTLVPGVTTVLGVLDKPALGKWRWQCGKDGIEWPIPSDATAGVGTICHYKIQCYLSKETEEYDPNWKEEHIKAAQLPFETWLEYFNKRKAKAIRSEYSLTSEEHRYGGTLDLVCDTDKGLELWDMKTSKAIYDENFLQLAAYRMLLPINNRPSFSWNIRSRVVLITKDGRLEAPDVSSHYMDKAAETWTWLIGLYHKLEPWRRMER